MTAPAAHKRTSAAERRANRAAFQELKEAQRIRNRPANLYSDRRTKVRNKLRHLANGIASKHPFTADQLGVLRPAEFDMVDGFARARLAKLTEEERANLRRNLCLLIALPNASDFRALVEYGNGRV